MKNQNFKIVNFYQSNQYDLFKFFKFNRDIDKNHVKTLKTSISERGFSGSILVVLTSIFDKVPTYYILDGQHRFTAAQELNIPFTFDIVEVSTAIELAKYIADVNNSSKAWGTNQFLNVWADMEIAEYIKLRDVTRFTGVQITPLIEAYTNQSSMREFRKGTMKFTNEDESDQIISQLVDLNQYLPKKAFCRRSIIRVMRHKDYDHNLIKPYIIHYAKTTGFTENEKELRDELKKLIRISKRVTKLVA